MPSQHSTQRERGERERERGGKTVRQRQWKADSGGWSRHLHPPQPISGLTLTLIAVGSLPAALAAALALDAASMAGAIGHLALPDRDVALRSLPAILAVADAAAVVSMRRAENRTNACKEKSKPNGIRVRCVTEREREREGERGGKRVVQSVGSVKKKKRKRKRKIGIEKCQTKAKKQSGK